MYLSGHIVGLSYLSFVPPPIQPIAYEKVTLFGQQNVDYLWIKNRVLTNAELNNIAINDIPKWDADTVLLANYQENINAGNITNLDNPIIKWTVQRQTGNNPIRETIATVPNNIIEIVDYTVTGRQNYQYFVFPITATETGEPLATDLEYTDFYNWSLTDPTTNIVFLFDFNLESGDLINEIDRSEYETYQKYNKISRGKRDFIRGNINCIAGYLDDNGDLKNPISYINLLRNTINNGQKKYLKSRKGDIWLIDTYDFKFNYNDKITDQPQQITFQFCEVGEVM